MAKKQTRKSLSLRFEVYKAAQEFYPTIKVDSFAAYVTKLILEDLAKNGINVDFLTPAPKPVKAKVAPVKSVSTSTELIGDLKELAKLNSKVADFREQVHAAESKPPKVVATPRIDIPGPPPKWRESPSSLHRYSDIQEGDFKSPGPLPPAIAPLDPNKATALKIDEIPIPSEADRAQLPEPSSTNLFLPTEPSTSNLFLPTEPSTSNLFQTQQDPPVLQVVPEPIPTIPYDCDVPAQPEKVENPKKKKKKVAKPPEKDDPELNERKKVAKPPEKDDPELNERRNWDPPPKHLTPEITTKALNDDFGGGMVFSSSFDLDEPTTSSSRYVDLSRSDLDDLVGDITTDAEGNSLLSERAPPPPPKKKYVNPMDGIPGPPPVPMPPREDVPLSLWVCNGLYIAAQNVEQAVKYTSNSTRAVRESLKPVLYEGDSYNRECLVPGILPADELRAVFEKKESSMS